VIRNERGGHGERNSALWGTGNRGGESRSNALWGKSGRSALLSVVAALALVVPLAASAGKTDGNPKNKPGTDTTYIAPAVTEYAKKHSDGDVSVIIQSTGGLSGAKNAYKGLGLPGDVRKELGLVGAVAADIPAKKLDKLAEVPGLVVTPDAVAKVSGVTSKQLWPYEATSGFLWANDEARKASMPTIAIVDSGIDDTRKDFTGRVLASVNLSTLPGNSPGDGRGHGTFVAGIAAGGAAGYGGAAPFSKLVSIDVMDDNGAGKTSDIITACQWILDNKDKYNIKVANFSLHSATASKATLDPLDKAVEKLWFAGVTVVAAAGNYGTVGAPSGVKYAPGNDPFVITVGAADISGSFWWNDDTMAPWSAYGYTYDGFRKPELSAPGRFMVGPVSGTATLALQRADHVVAPGYMQLSGTSFAAPVVSGAAAQVLARHPDWTPDQVKGALMKTARPMPGAPAGSAGLGQVTPYLAVSLTSAPDGNAPLSRFVTSVSGGSGKAWDTASWETTIQSNASWDTASWLDASWLDASWLDASWESASWLDASWLDASWLDASWNDASWEDAAEGDATDPNQLAFDDADRSAALSSDLGITPDLLPPVDATTTTTATTTTATTTVAGALG
jgi:serine protease AprX